MENIENIIAKDLGWSITNIQLSKLNMGDVNTSYVAKYEGENIFIKIQNKDNLPKFYSQQIMREVCGIQICSKNKIPCSEIISFSFGETPYIITKYINDSLLSSQWEYMTDAQKLMVKKDVLIILKKFRNIHFESYGSIIENGELGNYNNWGDAFYSLIQMGINDCKKYGTLNNNEELVILEATKDCTLKLTEKLIPSLNHMDLHWNNIFVKKQNDAFTITGIIDFGSALAAPYYMDLFRLNGGFLYGTEKFYKDIDKQYKLDENQLFSADLLNTIDYFIFLSFMKHDISAVKTRMLEICSNYMKRVI